MTKQIVIGTNNPDKYQNFEELFAGSDIQIISQTVFNVPEAIESGLTFVENAILKARNACEYTGLPAISDDSGLAVDFLNGQPGIYSARYASEHATYAENNAKLLDALKDVEWEKRTASFHGALVYLRHAEDPSPIIALGVWEGVILNEPIGERGFGYMPIFYVPTDNCSAAQLLPARKNELSHRGKAMKQLLALMKKQNIFKEVTL